VGDEFVRTVLPLGTTAVAADPHEIANVFGIPGVGALVEAAAALPFTFGVCASSCVPASPSRAGRRALRRRRGRAPRRARCHRGAEVMNSPRGRRRPEMLARIATAGDRRVDGHAPGLSGRALDAYLAAGSSPTTSARCSKRPRKSAARACGSHPPGIGQPEPHGADPDGARPRDQPRGAVHRRPEPDTLLVSGHLNDCVAMAVAAGVSEIDALVLATANPATITGSGNSAPSRRATSRRALLRRAVRLPPGPGLPSGATGGRRRQGPRGHGAGHPVPTGCAVRSTSMPRRASAYDLAAPTGAREQRCNDYEKCEESCEGFRVQAHRYMLTLLTF